MVVQSKIIPLYPFLSSSLTPLVEKIRKLGCFIIVNDIWNKSIIHAPLYQHENKKTNLLFPKNSTPSLFFPLLLLRVNLKRVFFPRCFCMARSPYCCFAIRKSGQLRPRSSIHARLQLKDEAFGYLKRIIVIPAVYLCLIKFLCVNIRSTGQKSQTRKI